MRHPAGMAQAGGRRKTFCLPSYERLRRMNAFIHQEGYLMRHGPLQFVFPGIFAVILSLPATVAATAPPGTGTGQSQSGGYKVGDKVQVNTGFGWIAAQILKINGN